MRYRCLQGKGAYERGVYYRRACEMKNRLLDLRCFTITKREGLIIRDRCLQEKGICDTGVYYRRAYEKRRKGNIRLQALFVLTREDRVIRLKDPRFSGPLRFSWLINWRLPGSFEWRLTGQRGSREQSRKPKKRKAQMFCQYVGARSQVVVY